MNQAWLQHDRLAWDLVAKRLELRKDARELILKMEQAKHDEKALETAAMADDRTAFEQSPMRKAALAKRADLNGQLDNLARTQKRADETFEQSYARVLETPEGREIRAQLDQIYRGYAV